MIKKKNIFLCILIVLILFVLIKLFLGNSYIFEKFTEKSQVKQISKHITVCVACHPPYLSKLELLLESINKSSLLPFECIIGLSETDNKTAKEISKKLNSKFDFNIRITSSIKKCNQAKNRNRAIDLAKTKYVTICDSDDIVHKDRLKIVYEIMENNNCLSLLHGYIKMKHMDKDNISNNWDLNDSKDSKVEIYDGIFLYDKMKETEGKYIHLGLNCHNAYITFQKKIFEEIKQNTSEKFYRKEDSKFVRDILKYYGRNKNTMIFYNVPLVKYF